MIDPVENNGSRVDTFDMRVDFDDIDKDIFQQCESTYSRVRFDIGEGLKRFDP